jgi:uncharacterized membrane protein YheB (UPF0754 family)
MGISQVRPAETHCCTCISNVQLKMIKHLRWIVSNPLKQKLCKLAQRYWCKKKWSRILQNCSQIETTNKIFFIKVLQESLHKFIQQANFFKVCKMIHRLIQEPIIKNSAKLYTNWYKKQLFFKSAKLFMDVIQQTIIKNSAKFLHKLIQAKIVKKSANFFTNW